MEKKATMIVETDILKRASDFVTDFLAKNIPEVYTYHNLEHTHDVVEAAELIGEKSGLDEETTEVVLLAVTLSRTLFSDRS